MHQQPLLAPPLPKRASRAGQRKGVSGWIVRFMRSSSVAMIITWNRGSTITDSRYRAAGICGLWFGIAATFQFSQPVVNRRTDLFGVILRQVVKTRANVDHLAVLQSAPK